MSSLSVEKPRISIIVEGYNESIDLGEAMETVGRIAEQKGDLSAVEVILTGSQAQAQRWKESVQGTDWPFWSLQTIGEDDAHYYRLKNLGANAAKGDILVFVDSDVVPCPGWLQSIQTTFDRGATASAGLSLFFDPDGKWPAPVLDAAAAISWGFIAGDPARGMLNHNFAIRADAFRSALFAEQYGRTLAGSLLYRTLLSQGVSIRWVKEQAVAHRWAFRWWVASLHLRFGHEVYRLRREQPHDPYRGLLRLGFLEPLLTAGWHVLLDLTNWLDIERRRKVSRWRRFPYLPMVFALSLCARSGELAGMYATAIAPQKMSRFAARH
jgi:glycosyltransferase involved in cell wall biosynthesis